MIRNCNAAFGQMASAVTRTALLLSTALVGLPAFMNSTAFAACDLAGSVYTCANDTFGGLVVTNRNASTTVDVKTGATVTNGSGAGIELRNRSFGLPTPSAGSIAIDVARTATVQGSTDGVRTIFKEGGAFDIRGTVIGGDDGLDLRFVSAGGGSSKDVVVILGRESYVEGTEGNGVSISRRATFGDIRAVVGDTTVKARGLIVAGEDGVNIEQLNSSGDTSVNMRGRIRAGEDGVSIDRTFGSGAVNVSVSGRISAGEDGIDIARTSDVGDVQIDVSKGSRIRAAEGDGVSVLGVLTNGDVTINVGRARISSVNGSAINVVTGSLTDDNNVTISNRGLLVGKGSGDDPTVRVLTDGIVSIVNDGVIRNADRSRDGVAVSAIGGVRVSLTNNDYLRGSITLGLSNPSSGRPLSETTSFDNLGTWETSGQSGFGASDSVFLNNLGEVNTRRTTTFRFVSDSENSNHYNNSGTTNVNGVLDVRMSAPNDANYVVNTGVFNVNGALNVFGGAGLLFENNGGIVDMRSGATTDDRVFISGNYMGGDGYAANSRLGIDTFLGGFGSTSDLMTVGDSNSSGSATGVTSVIVRDANFGGPGAYNPTGIEFVRVTSGDTQLGQFVLNPASDYFDPSRSVLDKGLFFYDIATRNNADGSRSQVLIGAPDREAFELPRAMTAAQNIWHESAGVWLDRQADLRHQLMKEMAVPAPVVSKGDDAPAPVLTTMGAITPGAWLKTLGSWTDASSRNSYSILDRSYSFNMDYKQDTFGVIGGVDFGTRGMSNPNDALVFGALAGYLKSDLDFSGSRNGFSYEGATIGLYASYLNRGFFADLLGKADLLKMTWSAPTLSGLVDTRGDRDANSYGFRFDTGYRYSITPGWFLEPSATLAYVKTSIDSYAVPGGVVSWPDADSFRGALGLRLGGTFAPSASMTMEASITGRIWNEFEGNNKASIANLGPTFVAVDPFQGAFGEVAGSLNFFGNNSPWSGFINAGVKFNDELTTTTAKAGVRYVFGKAPAPVVAPEPVVSVRY